MAEIETLGLIEEIESLVSDKLQVVSYKWLSRNYMLSSNAAKRLLQEFVKKHGSGLEVIYTLSGWLKSSPPNYHIKLVTGPKLAEEQEEYDGNCSVQVYSVQASIPKDPAELWNVEFIQAEELFKQPFSVDNCLRDNRFCGVSNSSIRRLVDGTSVVTVSLQTKAAVGLRKTTSNIVHQQSELPQTPQNKAYASISKAGAQSPSVVKDVNSENDGTRNRVVHDQASKPPADKKVVLQLPTGKKKVQADKSCSASGGSLANLWGRASVKSKPSSSPPAENSNTVSSSAEAQICVREAEECGSSDADCQDVNLRRSSNGDRTRKRRVVFDFSDEDESEDAINVSSPDVPKLDLAQDQQNDKKLSEKATLNLGMQIQNKSKVKEERASDGEANQPWREELSVISKCTSTRKSSTEKKSESQAPEIHVNKKDNSYNAASGSPKRRKVLKTWIDERGREVTEVVWEGEETEAKKADSNTTKKVDNTATTKTVNRAPAPKKPGTTNFATNPTRKGGKKTGNSKDPKQGNIISFFKRV